MEKYFVGYFDEEKAVKFGDIEVGDFFIDEDEELMMKIELPEDHYNAVSISRNRPGYVNFYQFSDGYECCIVSIDVKITEVI